MQHARWYAKVALFSACVGAGMEMFMIRTGFYEKVVDLEAQRRAEELQCAKEQLDASRTLQQQPNLSTLAGREETVGPS
ncbi:uncharacterized protein [Physcomitrium patens]|uniref:Uncharacterized protein n=1 Tax=Physcomitrium patens TaxID=3218 RepID=A0A2K1KP97_PHYPA|nr:uncharacterized protein LOC112281283 isoform X2 [Physcomitrium patens]PNR55604.1 hypothetical protein PHYPA_006501 [Physcomitrium patens]|eukprot:XP_024373384.1 uncharacterized protein LOC112281283 isoform X2 [Physcomitrella patens]